MNKLILGISAIALIAIAGLIIVRTGHAQSQFQGFSAVMLDYTPSCPQTDPACPPKTINIVKVLPTGESSWDTKAMQGSGEFITINTKTNKYVVSPLAGTYVEVPRSSLRAITVNDASCASMAAKMGGTYLSSETVAGHQAYKYTVRKDTVWLFPEAGCNQLQTLNDLGDTKTFQTLSNVAMSFNDSSVLVPKGKQVDVRTAIHNNFVLRLTQGTMAISSADAEARWTAAMSDPNNPTYRSVTSQESQWALYQRRQALQK